MSKSIRWRELHRCETQDEAWTIFLCLCAMEFDARLVDPITREPIDEDDPGEHDGEAISPAKACVDRPAAIEVADADWCDLREVLAEIIAEQQEFDAILEHRRNTTLRVRQTTIGVLAFIILALALSGLIEL